MRHQRAQRPETTRSNALWGRGSRGESRSNALWGSRRGGRSAIVVASLAAALALPLVGGAGGSKGQWAAANMPGPSQLGGPDVSPVRGIETAPLPLSGPKAGRGGQTADVPSSLLEQARANPAQMFNVIVQGDGKSSKGDGNSSNRRSSNGDQESQNVGSEVSGQQGNFRHGFHTITGGAATLSGSALLRLARNSHITAITPDVPVQSTGDYQNAEMWRETADVSPLWTGNALTGAVGPAPQAPAIAIVDSGVDPTRTADFGNRLVASVNLSSLSPSATGDGEGHGTMVAAIAAGAAADHPGVAQNAPIVSIRTSDNNGMSLTSDVIAAADWILANKDKYNIRVANFSMAGASSVSFRNNPLDKAVESLWFHGIVVVAASGNYGTGTGQVDMSKAPGNDPFVITVGATDQNQTSDPLDDTTPYWSAYGHTMDGFGKPDVAAPGRYMIAAIPMASTIVGQTPERVVAPGYIWMSGTSFSAPIVSGAAAQILALNPGWTPDQVKGALMLTANYLPANGLASGVGEIDAAAAATLPFDPPNPNENLTAFVTTNPVTGDMTFNDANWAEAVATTANWSSANWAEATWSSANWATANWASTAWSSANWASQSSQAIQSAATLLP
jgi:serine protease AprX